MVTIIDPHIKRDPDWQFFKDAEAEKLFVRNKDGADFDGCVWFWFL
jgi:alpha 1,3-glucosidase